MSTEITEQTVLENVVADLQAEGFEVYLRPSSPIVPEFLQNLEPDAIALGNGKKLVIEVLRMGPKSNERLQQMSSTISPYKDWELRVYWISPSTVSDAVEQVSVETVDIAISDVKELTRDNRLAPALLMGWAAFEALARGLFPEKFVRPQTPARLIEVLATNGVLTPNEAANLRRLAQIRNKLIHGGLGVALTKKDIDQFVKVLSGLTKSRARSGSKAPST